MLLGLYFISKENDAPAFMVCVNGERRPSLGKAAPLIAALGCLLCLSLDPVFFQVKEICFNRDTSLLAEVIPMVAEFQVCGCSCFGGLAVLALIVLPRCCRQTCVVRCIQRS